MLLSSIVTIAILSPLLAAAGALAVGFFRELGRQKAEQLGSVGWAGFVVYLDQLAQRFGAPPADHSQRCGLFVALGRLVRAIVTKPLDETGSILGFTPRLGHAAGVVLIGYVALAFITIGSIQESPQAVVVGMMLGGAIVRK